jgi:2-hydroxychromene-2-carboxylate isomerase
MTSTPRKYTGDDNTIRLYFSFRSPYSWLAVFRAPATLGPTGLSIEYIPVFPPPDFPNDPARVPAKLEYIREDIERQARAYGLVAAPLAKLDCEWIKPHAAFMYALDQARGHEFALEVFAARFSRSQDIGDDTVIAQCATNAGLDPAATVAAQSERSLQERVFLGMIRGVQEDAIFGVPLFVYKGERFWGNDRIEWLLRSLDQQRGISVPDLQADLGAPVVGAKG